MAKKNTTAAQTTVVVANTEATVLHNARLNAQAEAKQMKEMAETLASFAVVASNLKLDNTARAFEKDSEYLKKQADLRLARVDRELEAARKAAEKAEAEAEKAKKKAEAEAAKAAKKTAKQERLVAQLAKLQAELAKLQG